MASSDPDTTSPAPVPEPTSSAHAQAAAASIGKTTLKILVVGKTGVGKSSLINALVGYEVSLESEMEAGTSNVERLEADLYGNVHATIFDSPGLHDAQGREKEYMEQIVEASTDIDLILFCTKLTDTRVTEEDVATICEFTSVLGEKFWENAVFVLTFANLVQPKKDINNPESKKKALTDKHAAMKKKLKEVLRKKAKLQSKVVSKIPFVPAGYHSPEFQCLADGTHWFSSFWMACFMKVKEVGRPAVIQGCLDMFETEDEKKILKEQNSRGYDSPPHYNEYEESMRRRQHQMDMEFAEREESMRRRQLQLDRDYAELSLQHRRNIQMGIRLPQGTSLDLLQSMSTGTGGVTELVVSGLVAIGKGLVSLFLDSDSED